MWNIYACLYNCWVLFYISFIPLRPSSCFLPLPNNQAVQATKSIFYKQLETFLCIVCVFALNESKWNHILFLSSFHRGRWYTTLTALPFTELVDCSFEAQKTGISLTWLWSTRVYKQNYLPLYAYVVKPSAFWSEILVLIYFLVN